jgi:hypothetical protein
VTEEQARRNAERIDALTEAGVIHFLPHGFDLEFFSREVRRAFATKDKSDD